MDQQIGHPRAHWAELSLIKPFVKVKLSLKNYILIRIKHFLFTLLLFSEFISRFDLPMNNNWRGISEKPKMKETEHTQFCILMTRTLLILCIFLYNFFVPYFYHNLTLLPLPKLILIFLSAFKLLSILNTRCPKKGGYWNGYFFSFPPKISL